MRFGLMLALLFAVAGDAAVCAAGPGKCCKTCVKGKACGDSCIAQNAVCHTFGGCACNG